MAHYNDLTHLLAKIKKNLKDKITPKIMTKIISVCWQPDQDGSTQKAQISGDENEGSRDRKQCSEFLPAYAKVLKTEKTFLSACLSRGILQACTNGTEAQRDSTVQIQARHGSEATLHASAWMKMVSMDRGDTSHLLIFFFKYSAKRHLTCRNLSFFT